MTPEERERMAILLGLKIRKHPKRLVIRELGTISFFSIHPLARDQIVTSFEGQLVFDLGVVHFELFNEGSEPPLLWWYLRTVTKVLRQDSAR